MNKETETKIRTPEFSNQVMLALMEITKSAGKLLSEKARDVFFNLTFDEMAKFSHDGNFPYRLAKSLLCSVAEDIEWQFSAETTKPEIKAIKRIRKSRYC